MSTYVDHLLLLVMIHTGGFDVVSKALCVVALFDDVQSVAQRVKFNRGFTYLAVQLVTLTTHLVLLERIVHHHLPQAHQTPSTTDHEPSTTDQTTNHRPQTRHHVPQTHQTPSTTDQTTHHLPQTRPGTIHHRPDTVYHRPDTIYHRPDQAPSTTDTPDTIYHRPPTIYHRSNQA